MTDQRKIRIIGGGLAGPEAALQAASFGCHVDRYEMRTTPISALSLFLRDLCDSSSAPFTRKLFHLRFMFPSFAQPSLTVVNLTLRTPHLKNQTVPSLACRRTASLLAACLCLSVAAAAQDKSRTVDPQLPTYQPQTVPTPHGHGYIMPDGSLRIVGFDDMAGMVAKWDEEFSRTHPGVKFTPILKGNGTAIPAITYDMAVFAPQGGGALLLELLPYEKIYGSKKDPVAALIVRVAHGSLNPAAKMSPLGIVVNKTNPIKSLTKDQVASIFSTGSGTGDLTNWSQIGQGGPLADKPIHPTGLYWDNYNRPDDLYMGEYMMYREMGPFPGAVFSQSYEQYLHYADVVKKVAGDPQAIGIVMLNKVDPSVRVVPLVESDGHTLSTGSAQDLVADRYPYPRDLYIYIRREPGTPFEPLVKEYMRMILSKEGQQAVAEDSKGYLPLNAEDVKAELNKLDAATTWAPRSKQGPMLNFPFPSPEPEGK